MSSSPVCKILAKEVTIAYGIKQKLEGRRIFSRRQPGADLPESVADSQLPAADVLAKFGSTFTRRWQTNVMPASGRSMAG